MSASKPHPFARVRVLMFDLDNTLWDAHPVLARAEAVLYEWLQQNCADITRRYSPEALAKLRLDVVKRHPDIAHDLTEVRLIALRQAATTCGYAPEVAGDAFAVFHRARNDIPLFDDVLPALERLNTKYRLASLTNGNADLVAVGLDHLFDPVLTARELGSAKPDSRAFLRACDACGLPPATVAYVGDDPVIDIHGARQSGLQTIWVNRTAEPWREGPPPDASVTDLTEIVELLL